MSTHFNLCPLGAAEHWLRERKNLALFGAYESAFCLSAALPRKPSGGAGWGILPAGIFCGGDQADFRLALYSVCARRHHIINTKGEYVFRLRGELSGSRYIIAGVLQAHKQGGVSQSTRHNHTQRHPVKQPGFPVNAPAAPQSLTPDAPEPSKTTHTQAARQGFTEGDA